jgi:integrase
MKSIRTFSMDSSPFLRKHKNNLSDRTCYNVMQAVSTFLIHYGIRTATGVLKEIGFPPTEVVPYTKEELKAFFAACTDKEDLLFKFFLHTMARDMEVANCEVRDLKFEKGFVHISPKPDRDFRLKGKRSGQEVKGRVVPVPALLMERLRKHCHGKPRRALVFPCRHGGVNYHFLRLCKRIAKRAGLLPDWREFDLHRWRKTGATRYHESGVSLRTLQYRLGHESLDVTILYLGIQDAAEQSSMDLINNGLLAAYV